ncbi:MAG: hypothetical protein NT045_03110 [Candidatus Aureabacteria bacterium]|nr:hypothetical protein [Candidatus Auribacterota bacterium]
MMDPNVVQHWLVWSIVAALLMLGGWLKTGSYLLMLGIAALLSLVEAILHVRLVVQVVSFVAASAILVLINWAVATRLQKRTPPGGAGVK